ncbi:hypothetical protein D3C81_806600 [compost metagenome]
MAAQPGRQTGGDTHQFFVAAVMADAQQDTVAGMPHAFTPLSVAEGAHLVIDPIGGAAQCQFAQGNQIALTEKVLDGTFGLTGDIHLAFIQTLAQIVRRQVNQHHLGGFVEHVIGHGFTYPYPGHAADHVVQAFQMLYVDGGQHVDTGIQQLFDILPALRMARAMGVAVRQLVHQDQCRVASQCSVEIKLLYHSAAILNALLRQQIQPAQQRGGFAAAMGFHYADQHVQPLGTQPLGFLQHGVGFAYPGASAEEHLQAATGLFIGQRQQAVRVGALLFLFHHRSSFLQQRKAGPARRTRYLSFN